ncbi:MAG: DUF5668 domain-containing protein [bacterium]
MDTQPEQTPQRRKRTPLGGIILLLIGILWLLQNLGLLGDWIRSAWLPIILIIVGVAIIAKRR